MSTDFLSATEIQLLGLRYAGEGIRTAVGRSSSRLSGFRLAGRRGSMCFACFPAPVA